MPRQTYNKLEEYVREARDGLHSKMNEPGGEMYRKLFSRDLEALNELAEALEKYRPVLLKTLGVEDVDEALPDASENVKGSCDQQACLEDIYEEDIEGLVIGEFSRLPKGGTIYNTAGDDVFVPEIWVRNLRMEHRDIVSAAPLGSLDGEVQLYEFAVLERRGLGGASDRVSVVGPVCRHGAEWYVYSDEEGSVISLKPKEVKSLGLKEGDTVEVAYPAGNLYQARIAWRYDDGVYLDRGREKTRREKTVKEQVVDIGDPVLAGKTVLIVGGDLYKESYRLNFNRRGAEFLWESGFQGGEGKSIESKVRSADVVVIVTEMMSHRIPNIEAMCKKHGKPYAYSPSKGSTGAVRECQRLLSGGRR